MAAPADDPEIAIAVFVENAGYGSGAAGRTASFMAERFLTGRVDLSGDRAWIWQQMFEMNSAPLYETLGSPGG
jgi:penicillin-binding protein 2